MMEPNGQEQGNWPPRDEFVAASGDEGGRDDTWMSCIRFWPSLIPMIGKSLLGMAFECSWGRRVKHSRRHCKELQPEFERLLMLSRWLFVLALLTAFSVTSFSDTSAQADVTLVQDGQARATIYAPAEVLSLEDKNLAELKYPARDTEEFRVRLRASVRDLAKYLEKMSGATVEVVAGPPAARSQTVPILIGALAQQAFGPPGKPYPYKQGFRMVVGAKGVGLLGESDLATSYAIYELLDELGCRWFIPSDRGEVIPTLKSISLKERDSSLTPGTIYRGIWYADDDYKRRNRCGGLLLSAGHALEYYLTKEDREQHPDFRAEINGKPDPLRLKWSHPGVAKAIADKIIATHAVAPAASWSLSPEDGMFFDESKEDRALDAGDFDTTNGVVAIADRLTVLTNRIAEQVHAKYPDIVFGMLAYANYIRPPIREKLHPSIVPQLAPIAYNRYQPITDDRVPGVKEYRLMVEGWGKAQPAGTTSIYFYAYNLAEVAAPFPMITKWGVDIPVVMKYGCKYWQPETMPNFETCMHGLYLGLRMAWNPEAKPVDIIQELNEKFYGHAAREMTAYWNHVDQTWVGVQEYSGCGLYFMKRWTPEAMSEARKLMNAGLAAAQTEDEKFRVTLANESLKQLELFVKLRNDLADGRYEKLAAEAAQWQQQHVALGEKYEKQHTFTRVAWTPLTIAGMYFNAFYKATYDDASRVAANFNIVVPAMRTWKFLDDKAKEGEQKGFAKPEFGDSSWKQTDVCLDSWSALGFHDYFGSMWYRTKVKIPAAPTGKKTYLWVGSTDGKVKVFVNGQHIPYVNAKGEQTPDFEGFCQPVSFDISSAYKPGEENQISLFCTRTFFNELGTGGLLSQTLIYQEN